MNESTYFDLFLNKYELERPLTVENRESGMNNTTRIVAAGDGRKYVLRIYNNHQDSNIVRLEHEVLKELSARPLPFRIPVPLPNKLGDTVSVAEDGKVSALFRYIEGKRPSAQVEAHIRALGKAAGELTAALGQIRPDSKPLYSPYFLLESTYEGMDCDAFTGLAERSEALAARRGSLLALQREREALQASTEGIGICRSSGFMAILYSIIRLRRRMLLSECSISSFAPLMQERWSWLSSRPILSAPSTRLLRASGGLSCCWTGMAALSG